MAKAKKDWREFQHELLTKLNIIEEYESLGVEFTTDKMSSQGYMTCWAKNRPHGNSPNAGVKADGGAGHGRYSDLGGKHGGDQSLSFFDFAAKYGPHKDWREAQQHYASKAGMGRNVPKSDMTRPEDKLKFVEKSSPLTFRGYTEKYGIEPDVVFLCGGKVAKYPASSPEPQYVLAFPAFGPHLLDGGPTGYVIESASGVMIQKYQGPDSPPENMKRFSVGGSKSGLVGQHGCSRLAETKEKPGTIRIVWKVEGLSDLVAMQNAIPKEHRDSDLVVTNLGGAGETGLLDRIMPVFAGRHVAIIHDADEPGQDGAKFWAGKLMRETATLRNVQLPYDIEKTKGKDLRDWFADGHTYSDLTKILTETRPIDAVTEDQKAAAEGSNTRPSDTLDRHQLNLKRIGCIPLGYYEDSRTLLAFSVSRKRNFDVKQAASRYMLEDIILDFGAEVESHIDTTTDPDPGKLKVEDVREALASECGKRTITANDQIGIGVWELGGRIVMVGAGEVVTLNGKLERTVVPEMNGKLLDISASAPWYDYEELEGMLKLATDPKWCRDVFEDASNLFARWDNWKYLDTPELVTGLICATWLQTTWTWRPLVAVTGPTNSGKSMFMESTLKHLFGPLSVSGGQSTEAGVRQAIGHTGRVMILDEFEDDRHRDAIMAFFRGSSRGSQVLRGTVGQKGMTFTVRHVPWFAAIETGMKRQADRNRYIFLDLVKPKSKKNTLVLPSRDELWDLGKRLLAVALTHWVKSKALAATLSKEAFGNVDRRIIESYSVPCAILGAVMGWDDATAIGNMDAMLKKRDFASQQEADEGNLLNEILSAEVSLDHGEKMTAGQLLTDQSGKHGSALARVGLKIYKDKGEFTLFIDPKSAKRALLKGTDMARLEIDQILLRIDGAISTRTRIAGKKPRGVRIPMKEVALLTGLDEFVVQDESSGGAGSSGIGDGFTVIVPPPTSAF